MEETEVINLFKFTDIIQQTSGNMYVENRRPRCVFHAAENRIIMGFTDNFLAKGDYIQFTKHIQDAVDGIYYEIAVNGEKVYKLSTKWDNLQNLYLIITELWREKWALRDEIKSLKNSNLQQ